MPSLKVYCTSVFSAALGSKKNLCTPQTFLSIHKQSFNSKLDTFKSKVFPEIMVMKFYFKHELYSIKSSSSVAILCSVILTQIQKKLMGVLQRKIMLLESENNLKLTFLNNIINVCKRSLFLVYLISHWDYL